MRAHHLLAVQTGEKDAAGGEMVQRRRQRIDVRAAVKLDVSVDLLRRDVRGRSQDVVRHVARPLLEMPEDVAQPEVGELHLAVGVYHYVLGLYVAVHDPEVVPGVVEGTRYRLADEKAVDLLQMLLALEIVLSRMLSIRTPITTIGFGFVPLVMAGILFGPVPAAIVAALADILGALLFPIGAYYPPLTVTSNLACC